MLLDGKKVNIFKIKLRQGGVGLLINKWFLAGERLKDIFR